MMLKGRGPGWKRHDDPIVLWSVICTLEIELAPRVASRVIEGLDDRARYILYHPTIDEIRQYEDRLASLKPWERCSWPDPTANVPSPWVPMELQVLPNPVSTRIHVIDKDLIQIWRGYGTELTDEACRQGNLRAMLRRDSSSDATT